MAFAQDIAHDYSLWAAATIFTMAALPVVVMVFVFRFTLMCFVQVRVSLCVTVCAWGGVCSAEHVDMTKIPCTDGICWLYERPASHLEGKFQLGHCTIPACLSLSPCASSSARPILSLARRW